jgi:hypothetical protein
MSWRAVCCGWRWTASAIPSDCQTERWRDYYPRPPGARRVDLPRPEVHRGRFPAVLLDLELDLLTFIERAQSGALDGGDVHEDVPASTCGLNETIALLRVEPLHRSVRHFRILQVSDQEFIAFRRRQANTGLWTSGARPGFDQRKNSAGRGKARRSGDLFCAWLPQAPTPALRQRHHNNNSGVLNVVKLFLAAPAHNHWRGDRVT